MEPIEAYVKPDALNYLDLHTKNFVDAVRKNDQNFLNTPIRSGSVAAINAQMGNIAYKTGSKVFWDAKQGNFGNQCRSKQTHQTRLSQRMGDACCVGIEKLTN